MAGKPMITELRIEGFKSFGSPMQTLKLGRLNFLIGANASGKTNLLSALRFLQDAVLRDAEYAVNSLGGIEEVRNKVRRKRPTTIGFKLDMGEYRLTYATGERFYLLDYDYAVNLDLWSDKNQPVVESEILTANLRDEKDSNVEFVLSRKEHKGEMTDIRPDSSRKLPIRYEIPQQEATRLALGVVSFFSAPCAVLRTIIEGWRFYNIDPASSRTPGKETPLADLGPSGENLSVILHKLEEREDGAFDSIVSGLRSVVPGSSDIKTLSVRGDSEWVFQVLEDKTGAINPESASDGTIRLLTLLAIAKWKFGFSSLVAIEEPETGLHPHLSEHIVGILRAASEERQVIVTTHNPAFLDFLEPEEVILCDKIDGVTQFRRASDIEEIETFRKRFSLGELWTQGVLGAVP